MYLSKQRVALAIATIAVVLALSIQSIAQTKPTVIFVVSPTDEQDSSVDAVLMYDGGRFKAPYAEENEQQQKKFAEEFFASGKQYRLTFGGGEVGSILLKSHNVGCNNIHARASINDGGRIPKHLSALANSSAKAGVKSSSRRSPTTEERAAVMQLVQQIYRSRRTPASLLRSLTTTNLTASDLDGDGKWEMIGSFVIKSKTGARRDLFLIAEPNNGGFKSAFVEYQSYKPEIEDFHSAIDFVDQLDVDGDGVDEVFTMQRGYDAYGYNIYRKTGGRWREVLRTIGDAC